MSEGGLKACVHCGGEAGAYDIHGEIWIECSSCRMSTNTVQWSKREEIVSAWNRRASPPPRHIDDWHEEHGDVLWWRFPVIEPPYLGSPLSENWPGDYTYWTPLAVPEGLEC